MMILPKYRMLKYKNSEADLLLNAPKDLQIAKVTKLM